MHKKIHSAFVVLAAFTLMMGCSSSGGDGPTLQDLPRYPNAIEGESMTGSSPGGFASGSLMQFTTGDSFDEVVDFYSMALAEYDVAFLSHKSPLGRQTAVSIPQEDGVVSVAIQEFTEEGKVNITFMAARS